MIIRTAWNIKEHWLINYNLFNLGPFMKHVFKIAVNSCNYILTQGQVGRFNLQSNLPQKNLATMRKNWWFNWWHDIVSILVINPILPRHIHHCKTGEFLNSFKLLLVCPVTSERILELLISPPALAQNTHTSHSKFCCARIEKNPPGL